MIPESQNSSVLTDIAPNFCHSATPSPMNQGIRHPVTTAPDTHPPEVSSETEKSLWAVEDESDIPVNRIIEDLLPEAISIDKLRYTITNDPKLSLLKEDILSSKYCRKELLQYKQIFKELSYINGVIMRGNRIVILDSLQANCIAIAHEAHQGASKTLSYLRKSCWFPNTKISADEYVETCIPCLVSVPNTCPEPLKPNFLPDRPWQKLHADFKEPVGSKYYLHVPTDQFCKYSEVDVIFSTSFSKLKPRFDRILATHGVPDEITTDNGPPYFSDEMACYAKKMGFRHHSTTPLDPQSNGFAENFVKSVCKLAHTATVEGKDPRKEIHAFLLQYHSTPHSTTDKCPTELLFGHKLKTKLPSTAAVLGIKTGQEIRAYHDTKKLEQKLYADKRHRSKSKKIQPGDKILIKQHNQLPSHHSTPIPMMSVRLKPSKTTLFTIETRVM